MFILQVVGPLFLAPYLCAFEPSLEWAQQITAHCEQIEAVINNWQVDKLKLGHQIIIVRRGLRKEFEAAKELNPALFTVSSLQQLKQKLIDNAQWSVLSTATLAQQQQRLQSLHDWLSEQNRLIEENFLGNRANNLLPGQANAKLTADYAQEELKGYASKLATTLELEQQYKGQLALHQSAFELQQLTKKFEDEKAQILRRFAINPSSHVLPEVLKETEFNLKQALAAQAALQQQLQANNSQDKLQTLLAENAETQAQLRQKINDLKELLPKLPKQVAVSNRPLAVNIDYQALSKRVALALQHSAEQLDWIVQAKNDLVGIDNMIAQLMQIHQFAS